MKKVMKYIPTMIGALMMLIPNTANAQTLEVCDVNSDGKITVSDVLALVQLVLKEEEEPDEPSITIGEAVDLGLPSGVKWASCNVGATKPEEYGGYYAWGELEEKSKYDTSTYQYYQNGKYLIIGTGTQYVKSISGSQYDVARAKWGGNWRIPTREEIEELMHNCTNEWVTVNGVKGKKYTSKSNGNSIFLPATGTHIDSNPAKTGVVGNYWSSTLGTSVSSQIPGLRFSETSSQRIYVGYRYYGLPVRPVTY